MTRWIILPKSMTVEMFRVGTDAWDDFEETYDAAKVVDLRAHSFWEAARSAAPSPVGDLELVERVATAMEARRKELIAQPLARIWKELAIAAIVEIAGDGDE